MRILITLYYKIKNLIRFVANKYLNSLTLYYNRVHIKSNYNINGVIFIKNKGILRIGNYFKANSGEKRNPIGGDVIARLIVETDAELIIGDNVGISNTTIYATKKIVICNNVRIGGGCKIWDTDFHSLDHEDRIFGKDENVRKESVMIGENAFIGGGVIILKGVEIGNNSIVAAGSVVSKKIPQNEIWGGNPARFIRKTNI